MAVLGDRDLAGLLSDLPRRPTFRGDLASLAAQLVEITAARRAVMLKIDAAQHSLVVVAANGFDSAAADVQHFSRRPVQPARHLRAEPAPIRGESELGPRALGRIGPWVAVPDVSAAAARVARSMKQERAAELVSSRSVDHALSVRPSCRDFSRRRVILLGGSIAAAADSAIQLIALASPIVARLASLHESNELAGRLTQHRERLTPSSIRCPIRSSSPTRRTTSSCRTIAPSGCSRRATTIPSGDAARSSSTTSCSRRSSPRRR